MSHQPTGSEARRKAQTLAGTRRWLCAITALGAVGASAVAHADPSPKRAAGLAPAAPLSALAIAPSNARLPAPPAAPEWQVTDGVLRRGQTLSEVLRADGVSPQAISQIAKALQGHFSFRRAKPGHSFRLVRDGSGNVLEFRYHLSPTQSFTVKRVGGELRATNVEDGDLEPRATRIAGVITSTLFQSITNLGEDGSLARDFADIFAWDVDFQKSVRPGDSYQILYERLYREAGGRETYVRPGRILAARFQGQSGEYTAVYFESREGRGGYYRPDGSSVEGEFLMAPLRHARITSSYSSARRHPILKITRPHRGIDYAASIGTPVWSVADGVVIQRSWTGGNGNLVQVRHANGYVSSYAHLSRYADGLRVGDRVEQKQVIGFVGQTGLATGPHVCFRVQRNGKYVDPSRLRMPAGLPIARAQVPAFRATRDARLAELAGQHRMADGE